MVSHYLAPDLGLNVGLANPEQSGDIADDQQYSRFAHEVACGDTEFLQLNKFVETQTRQTV